LPHRAQCDPRNWESFERVCAVEAVLAFLGPDPAAAVRGSLAVETSNSGPDGEAGQEAQQCHRQNAANADKGEWNPNFCP